MGNVSVACGGLFPLSREHDFGGHSRGTPFSRSLFSDFGRKTLTVAVALALFVTGCAGGRDGTSDLLPASDVVPGWSRQGPLDTFDSKNLFDLVDGQAESYFAYGFEQVVVARYSGQGGGQVRVELYRLASPADAYGLFSVSRAGEPLAVGNDGDTDPGRRVAFWQERYYARILAAQPVEQETLLSLAQALAGALPAGGDVPELVRRLSPEGLVPLEVRFFRQELSIQSWLWLGGANVLGLGENSQGVLAAYDRGANRYSLLVVKYTDAESACRAGDGLRSTGVAGFVAAECGGMDTHLLAAVFGDLDKVTAEQVMAEAFAQW